MIAAYVMSGRMPAVVVATVSLLLSLLLPPLSIFSSAVIGLVSLRLGARRGLEVMVLGGVATALLAWLVVENALVALAALVVWLPLLLLGEVLRRSASLAWTLQLALLLGLVPLLLEWYYFSSGASWLEFLAPLQTSLVESKVMDEAASRELVSWMALWMSGIIAAALFVQASLGLFLARHWQAKLYNPGGFGTEFRALRFSKGLGLLAALVLVLVLLDQMEWGVVRWLAVLLLALYFFQGLSVLHALLGQSRAGEMWLIGVYLLLLFALPYMTMTLAATGFADSWWNFRGNGGSPGARDAGDAGGKD